MTTKNAKDLVTVANREVDPLSADEALARLSPPDTVLVDRREGEEVAESGKIAGAVHVPPSPALEKEVRWPKVNDPKAAMCGA
jgi:rhodanese-related sulfurtransferase